MTMMMTTIMIMIIFMMILIINTILMMLMMVVMMMMMIVTGMRTRISIRPRPAENDISHLPALGPGAYFSLANPSPEP